MKAPRLFSIPAGNAFLPSFVDALYQGQIVEDFRINDQDPAALASALIYVPTRRAARALRAALVEKSPFGASFLPTIRPLGDVDENDGIFDAALFDETPLLPPIPQNERLMLLAGLVRPWRENLPSYIRALYGSEDVVIPASTADAVWLARALANLMDEMERENGEWDALDTIAPDLVAEWWQVTLEFLQIIRKFWPKILQDRGYSNPVSWRNALLKAQTERLAAAVPSGPVIAAGSTGSIPATAHLLKTIAGLEKGALILPGLDRDLDEASWQALGEATSDPSVYGHPQYGLKCLLDMLPAKRDMVTHLGLLDGAKRARETYVSAALCPAGATDKWAQMNRDQIEPAFANFCLIEAASEREEAVAVACTLRDAIEDKTKTAALVTNDRNLARRVAAELLRFGVKANDSGGRPLSESEPAALLRLMLNAIFSPGDPVVLLSLLKHPLTRLQEQREHLRALAEKFELVALRRGTGRVSLASCQAFLQQRLAQKYGDSDSIEKEADMASLLAFAQKLEEAIHPLAHLAKSTEKVTLSEAARQTIESFENFGRDIDGSLTALYKGEAGQALIGFFRALVVDQSGLTFAAEEWPSILDALLADETIRPGFGGHPRLFIWGALEARLQTVDTLVLAGLNEGTFPAQQRNDPFMSRQMKIGLSLEPPERRIGLAAHDFQMALGMDQVVLSRALRAENAPSVPSRWLQRLETVMGGEAVNQMRHRGEQYLHWARQLDQAPDVPFVRQPEPKPPLEARPDHFSITEIETLRRDPYAIYAKKILRLKPLDDLIHDPSVAERGTLYHDIIATFIEQIPDVMQDDALARLMQIARNAFDKMQLPLDVEAIWWPRFEILAQNYLIWERGLSTRRRLAEVKAKKTVIDGTHVTISGRADRIDLLAADYAELIDFKTGSSPSLAQAASLIAPQLPLEGALLMRDAFEDCQGQKPSELLYVRLRATGEVVPQSVALSAKRAATELAETAWQRLVELVTLYQDPAQGYRSRALPPVVNYEGDYDHLARVREWSAGGDGEGE